MRENWGKMGEMAEPESPYIHYCGPINAQWDRDPVILQATATH